MKTVVVNDENWTGLDELARTLAAAYGWTKYRVRSDRIEFWAKTLDKLALRGFVDQEGRAFSADDPGERLSEFDVDWAEVFDSWSNIVWAHDAAGRLVMLHD